MAKMKFPAYCLSMTVEPRCPEDRDRLIAALADLARQDIGLQIHAETETPQIKLRGQDELHLDSVVEALKTAHRIEVEIGAPSVGYLECPTRRVDIDYAHKRVRGGRGEFARLIIHVSPSGNEESHMEILCADAELPALFHGGLKRGFESVLQCGPMMGAPVVGTIIRVKSAAFHDTDSSPVTFEIAARAALRDALDGSRPQLLEPVMAVEVTVAEEFVGSAIGDINARRGTIIAAHENAGSRELRALVPLANMFGYISALRALTRGTGQYTMAYDHHAPVPGHPDEDPDNFPPAIGLRA